jgi:hypothetical protein
MSRLTSPAACCSPRCFRSASIACANSTRHIGLNWGPGIRPGDDFFAYANGGWLKATEIPAGKDRWSTRTRSVRLPDGRSHNCSTLPDRAMGSTARKVADFLAAYLNGRHRSRASGHSHSWIASLAPTARRR